MFRIAELLIIGVVLIFMIGIVVGVVVLVVSLARRREAVPTGPEHVVEPAAERREGGTDD